MDKVYKKEVQVVTIELRTYIEDWERFGIKKNIKEKDIYIWKHIVVLIFMICILGKDTPLIMMTFNILGTKG